VTTQLDAVRAFVASERRPGTRPGARAHTSHVLAVAGGKGGVGTSTIAALLAATWASHGRRVLIVDASRQFAALHALLGVTPTQGLEALHRGRLEPGALLVPVADGLSLLPGELADSPTSISPAERVAIVRRAATLFTQFDRVVLDAGATVESVSSALGWGAERLIACTVPDRIALAATYALLKLVAGRFPAVSLGLLVNRADHETSVCRRPCWARPPGPRCWSWWHVMTPTR
jgi:MinD-like ATPase involved in chromosome partitioning or flagellar assembly